MGDYNAHSAVVTLFSLMKLIASFHGDKRRVIASWQNAHCTTYLLRVPILKDR